MTKMLILIMLVVMIMVAFYSQREHFWAPTPEGNQSATGVSTGPHGRELNKHDFAASINRQTDETKTKHQDEILDRSDFDYLEGGDYLEYWYNKPYMSYKKYTEAVKNKQLQCASSEQTERYPRLYNNHGWYDGNTCDGMPGYDGTYEYGEANSVGNKIVPPDEQQDMDFQGQDYEQGFIGNFNPSAVETTGTEKLI